MNSIRECLVFIFCQQVIIFAHKRKTSELVEDLRPIILWAAFRSQPILIIQMEKFQLPHSNSQLYISNSDIIIILILREALLMRSNLTMTVKNGVVRVPILPRDAYNTTHVVNISKGASTYDKSNYYTPLYQRVFVLLPLIT